MAPLSSPLLPTTSLRSKWTRGSIQRTKGPTITNRWFCLRMKRSSTVLLLLLGIGMTVTLFRGSLSDFGRPAPFLHRDLGPPSSLDLHLPVSNQRKNEKVKEEASRPAKDVLRSSSSVRSIQSSSSINPSPPQISRSNQPIVAPTSTLKLAVQSRPISLLVPAPNQRISSSSTPLTTPTTPKTSRITRPATASALPRVVASPLIPSQNELNVNPSTSDPWSHLPFTWPGRAWLSVNRFTGINTTTHREGGMTDPPLRVPPPKRHLTAAFAYTAAVRSRMANPALRTEANTGRPLLVPKEEIFDGRSTGWKGVPGVLDEEKKKVLPRIQKGTKNMEKAVVKMEEERRAWVKRAFQHAWEGYKAHAWGEDQVKPSGDGSSNSFNGWAATIVDSLDTLLIMNLSHEYNLARDHVRAIDFTYLSPSQVPPSAGMKLPDIAKLLKPLGDDTVVAIGHPAEPSSTRYQSPVTISLFETVIRFLGGFLSAYDLSLDPLMLARAIELGDWLLPSCGTRSGFPVGRYEIGTNGKKGRGNGEWFSLAEVGTLTVEFTRLTMLTGDARYFDAAQRITDTLDTKFVAKTKIPRIGKLLPTMLQPDSGGLGGLYTFGAMADSAFEYFIKQHQLLQGSTLQYSRMYSELIDSAYEAQLIRKLDIIPGRKDLTIFGQIDQGNWSAHLEHLTCFAGGMMAMGSRLLNRPKHLNTAEEVTNACVYTYESSGSGIGAEKTTWYNNDDPKRFKPTSGSGDSAELTENDDRVLRGNPPGVLAGGDTRYIGRPETIESVFYMYRTTGDRKWQDKGWKMFTAWIENCIQPAGFADIADVYASPVKLVDSMESFVLAETFKYYYLLFSPSDFISLDDFVFNTEAHPLRIPKAASSSATSSLIPPSTPILWTGLDDGSFPSNSTVAPGKGSISQLWARVHQAAALAPGFYSSQAKMRERERLAKIQLKVQVSSTGNEVDVPTAAGAKLNVVVVGAVKQPVVVAKPRITPIRPSEEELLAARKKQALRMPGMN